MKILPLLFLPLLLQGQDVESPEPVAPPPAEESVPPPVLKEATQPVATLQSTVPASPLQAAEATYRTKSAELREPILREYLAELKKLSDNGNLRESTREQISAEIKLVETAIENQTIPDYSHLNPKEETDKKDENENRPPDDLPRELRRLFQAESDAAFVLRPGQTGPAISRFKTLEEFSSILPRDLGKQSWVIPDLAPGDYEFVAAYEIPAGAPDEATIQVKLGANTSEAEYPGKFEGEPGTKDMNRLGRFKVEAAGNDVEFSLSSSSERPLLKLYGVYAFRKDEGAE
jgi:hypothetical protein